MAGTMNMLVFKQELSQTYKPYFDKYQLDGGMPFSILRSKLVENGVTTSMPEGRIYILLKQADIDGNQRISYDEFVNMMTNNSHPLVKQMQMSILQRFTRTAVSSVVPNRATEPQNQYVVDTYMSQYNCLPPPVFIILITVVELIVFIYYAVELKDDPKYSVKANSGLPYASPLIYNPSRRQEAWRYLTYMFIHNGYIHLIFNLVFQLLIGIPLEMVHKWWRVGILYFLGVLAGSLCHSVVDSRIMLAGASGGCYALIGAHLAIVVMNWKEMTHDWMSGVLRFISSGPVRLFFWIIFAIIDIALAIWDRYGNDSGLGIGYAAHFGGVLAGILIGIPLLKNIQVQPWEKVVFWICLIVYQILLTFAVIWNVFYPGFPDTDWRPCCPFPVIN